MNVNTPTTFVGRSMINVIKKKSESLSKKLGP